MSARVRPAIAGVFVVFGAVLVPHGAGTSTTPQLSVQAWVDPDSGRMLVSELGGRRRWSPSFGAGTPLAWSPDGTRLLASATENRSHLFVVDVARRSVRRLFTARRGYSVGGAIWSRDGSRVVFAESRDEYFSTGCGGRIVLASAEGRALASVGEVRQRLVLLDVSPAADRVLVLRAPADATGDCVPSFPYAGGRPSPAALVSLPLDGTEGTVLARNIVRAGHAPIVAAFWSPDGQQIAFTRCQRLPGGNATCGVSVTGATGGRERVLVPIDDPGLTDPIVAWSRDSRRILYGRASHFVGRDYAHALVSVTAATGHIDRVLQAPFPWQPTLSSDGRRIAFLSSSNGRPSIYVLDLVTQRQIRIPRPLFDNHFLMWVR